MMTSSLSFWLSVPSPASGHSLSGCFTLGCLSLEEGLSQNPLPSFPTEAALSPKASSTVPRHYAVKKCHSPDPVRSPLMDLSMSGCPCTPLGLDPCCHRPWPPPAIP